MRTSYEIAQNYESNYWDNRKNDPVGIIHDLESSYAIGAHLQAQGILNFEYDSFLDVGCGGLGIGNLWLINAKNKYGLDPLTILIPQANPFLDNFINNIQSETTYIKSKAENMPFDNNYFNIIVCNNVLDHVDQPVQILNEIKRVLREDGIFAFGVDIHSYKSFFIKKILKIFKPNYGSLPGHPHEWLESQMNLLLKDFHLTKYLNH